ncbi:hypothetical protein, partial [Infirmifilum sp.]|uniref:hypothetical protein n=1 Tax=Infirmifilum sp. TaxID=2856575 RepID=UPI003D11178D
FLAMFKHELRSAFTSRPESCTSIAAFRSYTCIPPDLGKALDSIDAMLRELEELSARIEVLLGGWILSLALT